MRQKSLVLILARDLADKLATAAFIVDSDGRLVYFNEGAENILGQSFADVGEAPLDAWTKSFRPTTIDGAPLEPEQLPLVETLTRHAPTHGELRIEAMDGTVRGIAVTALPLMAREGEFVGAAAVFWELGGGQGPAEGTG